MLCGGEAELKLPGITPLRKMPPKKLTFFLLQHSDSFLHDMPCFVEQAESEAGGAAERVVAGIPLVLAQHEVHEGGQLLALGCLRVDVQQLGVDLEGVVHLEGVF